MMIRMRDYVIATESNADLDEAFVKEHDICVIPHYYTLDEDCLLYTSDAAD